MEKNRFIIGDLVTTSLGIAKILDTYHNGDYYFEGKSFTGQDNNIGPIPLSSTILLKNGWINSGKAFGFTKNDITILVMLGEKYNECYVQSNFIKDITYVHELQHLLFGLGLNSEMEV